MYMCPVADADVTKDEPVQEKIIRLQKTLGGGFNGVWAAWVKKAAMRQGTSGSAKHDPKRNTVQSCNDLIQAWDSAGYDAYKMDSDLGLSVQWPSVKDKAEQQRRHPCMTVGQVPSAPPPPPAGRNGRSGTPGTTRKH
eukprot:3715914-Pyramimonas_sp.AAC.1